ncbi:MAG: hypothetical protein O4808_14685 [Trichodesmium sp. St17_bin3_1_1]|jgi:hypothetical protein|nr:hypothetical protein [Trichodesmium sp. St18_bin1]MDE5108248.1 hypothetical protein [Trichodesmium sp. St17_bin3_1_1]MDE5110037.1 hypothetical protein [Trichodesmium sp. St7_bin2_1]MDE5121872.1 hypothetical protein [Trichodesmium sp. St19_bin1]
MKHIVFFSSGAASYVAAKIVCEKYGKKDTLLLFADTTIEDKDNYRFLIESSAFLDCQLVWLKDGRNPWDIYDEQKFVNHRVSNCSLELKVKPCKDFIMNNFKPNDCHLYMGITFDEYERSNAINKNWNPYKVSYPLCWENFISKQEVFDIIKNDKIEVPRLYSHDFPHANCGGFCCKTGKKQLRRLLNIFPERYYYHENREQEFLRLVNKDSGVIIREYRNNSVSMVSLKEFRERLESENNLSDSREFEGEGGCGCFIDSV